MPYIDRSRANQLNYKPHDAATPEELAYVFCDLADTYLYRGSGLCARRLIELFGVLQEVTLEVQRRVGGPYEQKAQQRPEAADPFLLLRYTEES